MIITRRSLRNLFEHFLYCLGFLLLLPLVLPPGAAACSQVVSINAAINPDSGLIKGKEIIRYACPEITPLTYNGGLKTFKGLSLELGPGIYLILYPNSFYKKPARLKDYNFHQLYPYNFNRGYLNIQKISVKSIKNGYVFRIRFTTKIPEAYGNFGRFKGETVINAPFYPFISGKIHSNPPPDVFFHINLKILKGYEAASGGRIFKNTLKIDKKTNFISLVIAKKFSVASMRLNGTELNFISPSGRNFSDKNRKIFEAIGAVQEYRVHRFIRTKKINIVYSTLKRSLWLKPPLYSDTIIVSERYGDVLPYFYIYQKLNLSRGLIYLEIVNDRRVIKEVLIKNHEYYSETLRALSYADFKRFLEKYSLKNPDIKNILKHFNFIQGVNTVINYPKFPLYYVFFTGYPRMHSLNDSVYYFNNDLSRGYYEKSELRYLQLKKRDYYRLFLSDIGGNIDLNSGKTEGYLDFTLTKKYDYRTSYQLNISKNYYGGGAGAGFSRQMGEFFPISQAYSQSFYGMANILVINPAAETSSNANNYKRVTEFTMGYNFNSLDYNINPQYGSSFGFQYNISDSRVFSPFNFTQLILNYKRVFSVNADNIFGLRGVGAFSTGEVPSSLDFGFGGLNGMMGIPTGTPFLNNFTIFMEGYYERNILRGLNIDLPYNVIDITSVSGTIVSGAGEIGDTIPSLFYNGPLYSFLASGIHLKTFFFGIYPYMVSFYVAKGFGGDVTSGQGLKFYIGLDQPF